MNYGQYQRRTTSNVIGIGAVLLFHALVIWAMVCGLARKVVDVIKAPIETKVIEEVKKPPPPPEIVVPPPPRLEAPPPPFIPPPEVQIATPPPPAPTITAVTPTPPPAPVTIAPAPPPEAPAPPPPAVAPPKPTGVAAICTKTVPPEPPAVSVAGRATVVVSYTIQGGKVTNVDLVRYTFPGVSDRKVQRAIVASIDAAAREYVCNGDHVNVQQEFAFTFK
jgi:periplasmic protein TonB